MVIISVAVFPLFACLKDVLAIVEAAPFITITSLSLSPSEIVGLAMILNPFALLSVFTPSLNSLKTLFSPVVAYGNIKIIGNNVPVVICKSER